MTRGYWKAAAAAVLAAVPAQAHACAACFLGQVTGADGLLRGLLWGGALLLTVAFLGFAGIGALILRIERHRAKKDGLAAGKEAA